MAEIHVPTKQEIKEFETFKQGILNDVKTTLQRLRKQGDISKEQELLALRTITPAFNSSTVTKRVFIWQIAKPMSSFPFLTEVLARAKKQAGIEEKVEEKKEPYTHPRDGRDNEFLLNLLDEYKKEQEEKEQAKHQSSTIFCMNCGKKLPSTAKFCQFCGTKTLPLGQ